MATPVEPNSEEGTEVQGTESTGSETPGPNPAWEPVLNLLPEQFHSVVTPHFQKWDQSAQTRIEQANAQLKSFDDFKPFVEHGINAQEVEQGLRILWEINNNPENVYNALASAYQFGGQQNPPVAETGNSPNEEAEEALANIPPEILEKLNSQEGVLQAVAQIVLNDAKAKEEAQADAALSKELEDLKGKFGEYDEDYVLTKMQNGASGEEAVKSYQELVQRLTPKPFAPNVLGNSNGGTGLPSNAIDPRKLSDKETRDLVAQMLAQAAKQN